MKHGVAKDLGTATGAGSSSDALRKHGAVVDDGRPAVLARPRSRSLSAGFGPASDPDPLDELAELLVERLAARLSTPNPDATKLLDSAEAAFQLGVAASWLLAQARAGHVPHVRLGKYVRFAQDDVNAIVAAHRRAP